MADTDALTAERAWKKEKKKKKVELCGSGTTSKRPQKRIGSFYSAVEVVKKPALGACSCISYRWKESANGPKEHEKERSLALCSHHDADPLLQL